MVDERLLALDPELLEQIPELDHVGERAALVIGVIGEVAVQRLLGLVEELVEAAHRRVARVLGHPRLDLLVDREIHRVHLGVGLVAERPDEHAAEGVQVEPREDVRVAGREFHDRARLGRAARIMPRADLLLLRRPRVREIPVEVVQVVGEEEGRRNRPAVEVGDAPLGIEPEIGTRVLGHARAHHRRIEALSRIVADLHQLAVRVLAPHVARDAVTVDVGALPVGVALVGAVVDRARANVAAALEHLLRPVGRDSRNDVEQRLLDGLRHVRRKRLAADLEVARGAARGCPRPWRAPRSSRRARRRACCRRSRPQGALRRDCGR